MEISDNHKWLLDFCGYYNGEEENPFNERLQQNERSNSRISSELEHQLNISRMFWYYEECWVKFTLNMECGFSYCGEYLRNQLEDFLKDNGTPMTLKALLHNRFFHWSGGYDTVEGFKQWYIDNYEKYRDRSRQNKLSKGRMILNGGHYAFRTSFYFYTKHKYFKPVSLCYIKRLVNVRSRFRPDHYGIESSISYVGESNIVVELRRKYVGNDGEALWLVSLCCVQG